MENRRNQGSGYDFSWASNIDLIIMQYEASRFPEDAVFVAEAKAEFNRRWKEKEHAMRQAQLWIECIIACIGRNAFDADNCKEIGVG